jgi:uncharacterized membrane protein
MVMISKRMAFFDDKGQHSRGRFSIYGLMFTNIMPDIEELLNRWQSAGVLDDAAADRIRAWEWRQTGPRPQSEAPQRTAAGLAWQGVVAVILGGILLATGVILFVSAHWDDIGPGARFALVAAMVTVFHLAGAIAGERYAALSATLHAVGTVATGAAIALVGQIFNIEEHWPAAILMWAIAALAGWILLHDQAQQILTLLLFPAWIMCELEFYTERSIGQAPYLGRFLFVWGIFYLTMILVSRRRVVHGILFAVAAIAVPAGVVMMAAGWRSYWAEPFIPFGVRFWAWTAIAALPLVIAVFRGHWGLIPPSAAIVTAIALPWCQRVWVEHYNYSGYGPRSYTSSEPNLAAHGLVAAFAVFMIAWGMRQASRPLVNLGIVYFAVTVGWFYFSNIFDKVGRSLGLIGLGVLFLLGGWVLEVTRRRLLERMEKPRGAAVEAV